MKIAHTHKGIERCVYIPIQTKVNYPTMLYVANINRLIPVKVEQANLPAQILKATE